MPRYIDADALGLGKANRDIFEKPEFADGWNSAVEIIATAPAADVVEVKHGEWVMADVIEDEWVRYRCSECNYTTDSYYKEKCDLHRYCPNCGAKMDGKGGEW